MIRKTVKLRRVKISRAKRETLGLTISRELVDALGWIVGDDVALSVRAGRLIAERADHVQMERDREAARARHAKHSKDRDKIDA